MVMGHLNRFQDPVLKPLFQLNLCTERTLAFMRLGPAIECRGVDLVSHTGRTSRRDFICTVSRTEQDDPSAIILVDHYAVPVPQSVQFGQFDQDTLVFGIHQWRWSKFQLVVMLTGHDRMVTFQGKRVLGSHYTSISIVIRLEVCLESRLGGRRQNPAINTSLLLALALNA